MSSPLDCPQAIYPSPQARTFDLQALPKRFGSKIVVDSERGCWLWQSSVRPDGYGMVWADSKMRYAHIVVFELLVGAVPEGLELDHLCRRRQCVCPTHLEPVTRQENVLRSTAPQVFGARTACSAGHEYTMETTLVVTRNGRPVRRCRVCDRAREARRRRH